MIELILIGIVLVPIFLILKYDPLKKHYDSIPNNEIGSYKKQQNFSAGRNGIPSDAE